MFNRKNRQSGNQSKVEDLIKQAETKRLTLKARAVIKDTIWPLLIEQAKNIEDAKRMTGMFGTILQIQFGDLSKRMKVSELMTEPLNDKEEHYPFYQAMLELFKDDDVSFAQTVVTSIGDEITRLQRKESFERKLDTLKTDFPDDVL